MMTLASVRGGERIEFTPVPNVASISAPALPLVSIALINWNYGRFIGKCIDSIKVQSYPRIEVVIADNGSTDQSRDVIRDHIRGDSRFEAIYLKENTGPMNAALRCLERLSGEFVCFVDSDDYLFEDYVATHIQVHLALPLGVGMTSGNVIEVSEKDEMLTGGRSVFARRWPARWRRGLRHLAAAPPRVPAISDEAFQQLSERVYSVPAKEHGWFWSPGTGICYRRNIIEMIKPEIDPDRARLLSTDGHFAELTHWIAGSVAIDKSLSAYRVHGSNFFSALPSISGFRAGGGPASGVEVQDRRRREVLRVILERQQKLSAAMENGGFWRLFGHIVRSHGSRWKAVLRENAVREMLARAIPEMIAVHGLQRTLQELLRHISPGSLHAILSLAHHGKLPAGTVATLYLGVVPWSISNALRRARRSLRRNVAKLQERAAAP